MARSLRQWNENALNQCHARLRRGRRDGTSRVYASFFVSLKKSVLKRERESYLSGGGGVVGGEDAIRHSGRRKPVGAESGSLAIARGELKDAPVGQESEGKGSKLFRSKSPQGERGEINAFFNGAVRGVGGLSGR